MKIISWNVNGLRAVHRKKFLTEFLAQEKPDLFLLQEIKAELSKLQDFPAIFPEFAQYYNPAQKPGYAGTAIWARQKTSGQFLADFPNDLEGRVTRIDLPKRVTVLSIYFPNGGKSKEAFQGKLQFYRQVLHYVNTLRRKGHRLIFAGDFNCAHTEIDLARPRENENSIGFLPVERAWLTRYLQAGWLDVWRSKNPTKREVYSWWHLITRARARNVGWRIDYFFLDQALLPQVKKVTYLTHQMGSDHCPVALEINP